jgi:hypothetical protein
MRNRSFSIELKNKRNLRTITIGDKRGTVLLEGRMGETLEINHVDDIMLEICCSEGVLRVDLDKVELKSLIAKTSN